MSNTLRLLVATVVTVVGVAHGALAQVSVGENGRQVIHAVYVPKGINVDGKLDEPVYGQVSGAIEFFQQEPQEGAPATEKTEVWVLFDDQNLYVCARLWDTHPERLVASEMRRDQANDIYANDNFSIVLDTFHDQRTGYYFMTNALGALRDVQFQSEKEANSDWNPVWNPKVQRFERGWTVEAEIPFKSIRYPSEGEQVWGFNLRRRVIWKNEVTYATKIPAAIGASGVYRLQDEATLVGLRTPPAARNLDIKPYAISRLTTDKTVQPVINNQATGDVGGDLKYGIGQGLTADVTYNTDFAQVEDDLQQVNLTRFGVFFPEKREFFLEGQVIFNFGGAGGGDIPTMFFSRQIGLARGVAVPILGGGRLTGKAGKYSIGILNIQTDKSDAASEPTTNFGVVRVRHDILGRSYIGFVGTQRTPSGNSGHNNTLGGADAGIAFGVTTINAYYARTATPGLRGNSASYMGQYDYGGDRYGLDVQHLVVQPNFNPEMGFVRRQNFSTNAVTARFSPRPGPDTVGLRAFRKFYYIGTYSRIATASGDHHVQSGASSGSFNFDLNNGASFTSSVERDREVLDTPFQIAPGVRIATGDYSFTQVNASYSFQPSWRVRGSVSGGIGQFYDGTRQSVSYTGRVEIAKRFIIEPIIQFNWVDLIAGSFQSNLYQSRATYTISPRSWIGTLVQYNASAQTLSSNTRFRWEYTPGSDLFVVYSEGRATNVYDRFADLQTRAVVVKATHLFRY
jgi:hypothetical protein